MTRYKANEGHVRGDLALEFYSQRATVPGALLFVESNFPALIFFFPVMTVFFFPHAIIKRKVRSSPL